MLQQVSDILQKRHRPATETIIAKPQTSVIPAHQGDEKVDDSSAALIIPENNAVDLQLSLVFCPECKFNPETFRETTCIERANYIVKKYGRSLTQAKEAVMDKEPENCKKPLIDSQPVINDSSSVETLNKEEVAEASLSVETLNKEKVAEATTETNAGACNVPFQASEEFVSTKPKQNTSAPLCSVEQLKTGSWKPIRLPGPEYIHTFINKPECCSTEDFKNAKHWDSYFWEPSAVSSGDCQFLSWDRDEFCRAAQNITIAISGDSLSLEHFLALLYQLGYADDVDEHNILLNSDNIVLRVCNNQTTLVFRKGFWLEVVGAFLQDFTPNVLVLNTGSWYRPDGTLRNHISRRFSPIQNWYNKCQNQQMDYCLFVWRTTVPGHPQCETFTKPATSVTEMENMVANRSLYTPRGRTGGRGGRGYHWWDFKHQNTMVLKMMNESLTIPYEILPAYDINILRPDEHKAWLGKPPPHGEPDCLHSCAGSSRLTVLNQILFQLMKIRKP